MDPLRAGYSSLLLRSIQSYRKGGRTLVSTKGKLGTWLLWSLIPNGILGILSFAIFLISSTSSSSEEVEGAALLFAFITFTSWLTWWLSLLLGLTLKFWAGLDTRRDYRESRRYADLHGWQPISDISWKSFKRRSVTLSVSPTYQQPTFFLSINLDGETLTTSGFSKSLYALRFGDHLWEQVIADSKQLNVEVLNVERGQWEQTQALAVRR